MRLWALCRSTCGDYSGWSGPGWYAEQAAKRPSASADSCSKLNAPVPSESTVMELRPATSNPTARSSSVPPSSWLASRSTNGPVSLITGRSKVAGQMGGGSADHCDGVPSGFGPACRVVAGEAVCAFRGFLVVGEGQLVAVGHDREHERNDVIGHGRTGAVWGEVLLQRSLKPGVSAWLKRLQNPNEVVNGESDFDLA